MRKGKLSWRLIPIRWMPKGVLRLPQVREYMGRTERATAGRFLRAARRRRGDEAWDAAEKRVVEAAKALFARAVVVDLNERREA